MSYAVEVVVTTDANRSAEHVPPVQRLPRLHDTIEQARSAGSAFLEQNGAYMASKGPGASIAMFQVVDDGGDVVVPPSRSIDGP